MSSDTEIAAQYIGFVLRWFLGTCCDNPYAVLSFILSILLLVVSWRFLRSKSVPACVSSPWFSVFSLVLIISITLVTHYLNTSINFLTQELELAHWKIKQGSEHRVQLLRRLEGASQHSQESQGADTGGAENPLDGCLHVFIDLGSNRGLQIRKLYEPNTFPLAPVLPLYQKYFGRPEDRNLQEICSVSFEPNPKHSEHLSQLSEAYSTCGIRMLVYKAGVGNKNTKVKFAPFNSLLGQEVQHDASGRLIHEDEGETMEAFAESHFHDDKIELEEVEVVRFAEFINDVVAKRKLPTSAQVITPRVVIKADIEGAELKILPDMIMTGALQHVDNLHMEWHGEASYRRGREPQMIDKLEKAITAIAELSVSEGMADQFEIIEMDDETYSGILVYKPFGDYTTLPMMSC